MSGWRDGHHPLSSTCHRYVEESELYSGVSGCNLRIRVLANDGVTVKILVDDCGVHARQGDIHVVPVTALNGGRR